MIWLCKHCITWNPHLVVNCTVCNVPTTEFRDDNPDILETHLETIYWYMKAEVENRLHNLQVMDINVVQLNERVR